MIKAVFLNVWGGRVRSVYEWLESRDADMYLLQEVISSDSDCSPYDSKCLEKVSFDGYDTHFFSSSSGYLMGEKKDFHVVRGLAVVAKKEHCSRMLWAENLTGGNGETGVAMSVECCGIEFVNVHGFHSNTKTDTPERILQSRKILEKVGSGACVIGGDFNLLPETESIRMIGDRLRNLVLEYGIESTRTDLTPLYAMGIRHSDYVFTANVDVEEFSVPDVSVSDHKPLIIKIKK